MAATSSRTVPNILVTGTPGTGKSTFVQRLVAEATGMRAIYVGELVSAKQLHDGWDDDYQTYVLDEDKVRCKWARSIFENASAISYGWPCPFPVLPLGLCVISRACSSLTTLRMRWRQAAQSSITTPRSCSRSAGLTL
mmetsp:Transcript_53144/g.137464  ORF Transcript_53144/g.137464 Transcript_53144/m.137464 type:complete len:138 (+) Transcript_53144:63-476(+)